MTQKLRGLTTPSSRQYGGPDSRYNDMAGNSGPSDNLGGQPARGQILPRQALRKVTSDIPQTAVIGLVEDLALRENISNKGVPNGYAPLNASAKVPLANLPLPLPQSATHADADTDTAPGALHHTLGTGPNQAAAGNHTHVLIFSLSDFTVAGGLSVGAVAKRLPIDGNYTVIGTRLTANTAPTGASLIVDVNKNGSTIYTTGANRPSIAAAANSGGPGAAPDITALAAGDYLSVDIDQVGSGTPGSDLTVCVIVSKTI